MPEPEQTPPPEKPYKQPPPQGALANLGRRTKVCVLAPGGGGVLCEPGVPLSEIGKAKGRTFVPHAFRHLCRCKDCQALLPE